MKPNNIFAVKCDPVSFYSRWMELLTPWHHLSARERDVAARILEQYFRLKASIPDDDVLNEILWSPSSRKDMRESLKMTPAHFQMMLAKLRRVGILKDNGINPRFLPHKGEGSRLCLQVIYDWSTPKEPIHEA